MPKLFERTVYSELLEWKNHWSKDYALLVEGARRVGKSTVVKEFSEKEFKSALIIDFYKPKPGTIELFNRYGNEYDRLFTELQALYSVELYLGESVIVFDEIQLFPRAREMIKGLVEDGRYCYIETGSLITVLSNAAKIMIPSEEYRIDMYPMSFEEFCWAVGASSKYDYAKNCFEQGKQMGVMHRELMELFKTYMMIGGFPQSVSKFIESQRYSDCERVKKGILQLYHEDLSKIPVKNGDVAKRIFDSVPALLSKHEKRFRPGIIKKGSRTSNYENSLLWLDDAHICNLCWEINEPQSAINLTIEEKSLKCYMLDTGLLLTQSFGSNILNSDEVQAAFVKNKLNLNEGMIFENAVSQELKCRGIELRFTKFARDEKHVYEVDFIVGGKKPIPIEVKSGDSSRHTSLDSLLERNKGRITKAYIVHGKDVKKEGKITYLPIYMVGFLANSLSNRKSA